METQIYAGKCRCKRELDFRITEVRESDDPESKIIAWIIHGFCKKCKILYFQGLFSQAEKPVQDRDFIIDFEKVIKKEKK